MFNNMTFLMALRRLRKMPTSTLLSVVSLSASLTLLATLVILTDTLSFRRSSAPNAGRLVGVSCLDEQGIPEAISPAVVDAIRSRAQASTDHTAYVGGLSMLITTASFDGMGGAEFVEPEYFSALGARAMLGGAFTRKDAPSALVPARVAFVNYRFWKNSLGARADVVGQTITVDGIPATIVGVGAEGFSGLQDDIEPALVLPISFRVTPTRKAAMPASHVVSQLLPGRSVADASVEMRSIWPDAVQSAPDLSGDDRSTLSKCSLDVADISHGFSNTRTRYAASLRILLIGCGFLVALCALHLALGALARASESAGEIATLRMLGCPELSISASLLAESLVLVIPASLLSLALGPVSARLLLGSVWTASQPSTLPLTWRPVSLLVVLGAAVAAGVVMVAIPLLRVRRSRSQSLSVGARGTTASARTTQVLVGIQVAVSMVLTTMAVAASTGAAKLATQDLGVRADGVIMGRALQRPGAYSGLDEKTYYPELVQRIGALPGVSAVSLSRVFPLPVSPKQAVVVRDQGLRVDATVDLVSPGFLDVTGVQLLRGRFFQWSDSAGGSEVAVITKTLSEKAFGTSDPIGKVLLVGPAAKPVSVVGLIGDFAVGDSHRLTRTILLRPTLQEPAMARSPLIMVRPHDGAQIPLAELRSALAAMGKEYMPSVLTLESQFGRTFMRETVTARIAAIFAGTSAILCALSVFAFLSQALAQRRRELAVRMALGANAGNATRRMARLLGIPLGIGMTVGIPVSLLIGRYMETQSDVLVVGASSWATTGALVLTGALVAFAAALPAARVASINPVDLLRET